MTGRRTTAARLFLVMISVCAAAETHAAADAGWNPRERFLKSLVAQVPAILKSQDPATGKFGKEPWICEDQNAIFPLAAAWAIQDPANPHFHSPVLLEAIMKGGDALIAGQDKNGAWTFRKKDNSTWGQTIEPWPCGRWIRTFYLVKDAMPPERRRHWEKGLLLSFERVAASLPKDRVHNKPTYHAASVYCAGICFGREDWKKAARDFTAKIVAAQAAGGWWSEHSGPVVGYNTVYCEGLGIYHAMSRDPGVLEALRRAAVFHATFVYPDGGRVETVDERNPYERGVEIGNAGFSLTPEGRGFLLRQYERRGWAVTPDEAASHLLYGESGDAAAIAADCDERMTVVGDNEALVLRRKPWFVCLSAFASPPSDSRWVQDRQNFVSIFHDRTGLIVGGGNTKMQPFWSNFTLGDTALLQHKPGDEHPKFRPAGDLVHIPSAAELRADKDAPSVSLTYGEEQCRLGVRGLGENSLTIVCETTRRSAKPVEGHITFLPRVKSTLATAAGKTCEIGETPIQWSASDIGAWFGIDNVRVRVPPGARLAWPMKRHNPYKKGGESTLSDARLVLCLPFSGAVTKQEVALEIAERDAPR